MPTRAPGALGPACAAAPLATRPWIGILAVLFGAFISTIIGRLSTFGLADIRGAIHAGVDEGAWITTAQTTAQMLVGPAAGWFGMVYGARRVLFAGCLVFAAASALLPLSPDLPTFLTLQFVSGLGSGTFIPLTISFVLRNLKPQLWAYGMAAYALNLEFSLHVSASLEGWYIDHASWRWIFWQSVPLALAMSACVWWGIPREPVNRELHGKADWFGMASASLGLALIFAGLDQGNRLDWLNSGLVCGLLTGGALLLVAFVLHERTSKTPWLDLGITLRGNLPILLLLIATLRFIILSTAYVVPQFLTNVQGYRALDTGSVLLWIAVPQLLIAPTAGMLLRRIDARIIITSGFIMVGTACWLVSNSLTRDWISGDFLPSQVMQAVGQSFALSGIVFFGVLNLRLPDAITFGALLQIARLFGGEVGTGFMQTWVRVREQIASQLIGLHVPLGDPGVAARLAGYHNAVAAKTSGGPDAAAHATALLAAAIRLQANVQSYIDAFAIEALGTVARLALVMLLRAPPPGPALPVGLFARRAPAAAAN